MANILSLTAEEARDFFLKGESYCNFDLPRYFEFDGLLKALKQHLEDTALENKELNNVYGSIDLKHPRLLEGVNYKLISNKDGKYAWRPLQLIHPALYVYLVCLITEKENWKTITKRFDLLREKSCGIECEGLPVTTARYRRNAANQISHWLREVEKKSIHYSLDFDYLLHTDITDCYGSIYTHSIPWSLHDKSVAKENEGNQGLVGNQIDWLLQAMSNGQTNGIPQGSVLMDFLAEMVLCYIDSLLTERIRENKKNGIEASDYKIIRYRDDYRIFTNTPQHAEQILRTLTDILNDFGMRISLSKTKGSSDVVRSSIKPDKLARMINDNSYQDWQRDLLAISVFSQSFPNSGQIRVFLKKFYDKIIGKEKKDIARNIDIQVLISIVTDIAYKNPVAYSYAVAVLSKLVDFWTADKKEQIIKRILKKIAELPNNGILEIWLQRMTAKLKGDYQYSEALCKKVMGEEKEIWKSKWLNGETKKIMDSHNIVNIDKLEEMDAVISPDEVNLFKRHYY